MDVHEERRLFEDIGTRRRVGAPPAFAAFILLGLILATAAFGWELTHPPPRVTIVEIDLSATPDPAAPPR
jgi:hypothetical protein